jgi:hypothetical protein
MTNHHNIVIVSKLMKEKYDGKRKYLLRNNELTTLAQWFEI